MKDKKDIIKNILNQLRHIVDAHLSLEEYPITVDKDIILTPKEIHIIQAVGKNREMNIKELGDHFCTSKSAASQMISKLVRKGLIRKENPIENNKELKLFLTETGRKAFELHEDFHKLYISNLVERLDSVFDKEELDKASDLLKIIYKTMEQRISKLVKK